MPDEVQDQLVRTIQERQHEKMIKEEMRKMAEDDILREL
jgi:hypothetical protein